jgi:hypothetical protein
VQTYLSALGMVKRGLGTAVIDPFTALSSEAERVDLYRIEPAMYLNLYALQGAQRSASANVDAFIRCTRLAIDRLLPRLHERVEQ